MEKSFSECSFSSDQLEQEALTEDDVECDVAPWDIFGQHENTGQVVVAKEGESLPLTTKYKRKSASSIPVKFHVTKRLEVTSFEFSSKVRNSVALPSGSSPITTIHLNEGQSTSTSLSSILPIEKQSTSNTSMEKQQPTVSNTTAAMETLDNVPTAVEQRKVSASKRFVSESAFVSDLEKNFDAKIISGLEAGFRLSVSEKMVQDLPLLPKENNAVVNSLIQAIFDQYGPEKPDKKFCEKLTEVLKVKFPSTYRMEMAIQSPLGSLTMPKNKGDGGYRGLAKRIGESFYNRMVRPTIKRQVTADNDEVFQPKIKKKKGYCLSSEKWSIDVGASKATKDDALKKFMKLEEAGTLQEKKDLVREAQIFIQKQFRTLEPSQSVEDLRSFWAGGPEILSEWFEWLVGGSELGSLSLSATKQLNKILNIVEAFVVFKRGEAFEKELKQVREKAKVENGNILMYQIFLLKDLAKLFKNKPVKMIFVDGTDDKKLGPEEKDPNIFITKQQSFGEDEYEEKVSINLRIGDKIIWRDVNLTEALAGIIQIYFSFNLLYPAEVDDMLQFLERIVCKFGSSEGARNKKSVVKKAYREFEVKSTHFKRKSLHFNFSGICCKVSVRVQ